MSISGFNPYIPNTPKFGAWTDKQRATLQGVRDGDISDIRNLLEKNVSVMINDSKKGRAAEKRLIEQINSLSELKQAEAVDALLGDKQATTGEKKVKAGYNYRSTRYEYDKVKAQYKPSDTVMEALARAYRRLMKSAL